MLKNHSIFDSFYIAELLGVSKFLIEKWTRYLNLRTKYTNYQIHKSIYNKNDLLIISDLIDNYQLINNEEIAFFTTLYKYPELFDLNNESLKKSERAFNETKKMELINSNRYNPITKSQIVQLYFCSNQTINTSKFTISKKEASVLLEMHHAGIDIYHILKAHQKENSFFGVLNVDQ